MTYLLFNLDFLAALTGIVYLLIFRPAKALFGEIINYIIFQSLLLSVIFVLGICYSTNNNIGFYQLNAFGSCILLQVYFFKRLQVFKNKSWVKLFALITLLLGIYMLFFEGREALNSYSYGFVSLVITFLSFCYYFKLLSNPEPLPILHCPDFWFVTGLLLYYSLSMFIFLPYKLFTKLKIRTFTEHGLEIWNTQNIFYVIMILFLIKGFSCSRYYKTQ